jgi:conjugative relaxase-like TrwC/TraI family protein
MIRMIQSSNAAHAKDYFSNALSRADYYINDQELNGKIQGRLAQRLGITGPATRGAFFDLCDNVNPATGEPLTPRTREERTAGYDINFHCPKSVSILHGLATDDHLMEAFQASIDETMRHMEADSKTRIRKEGKYDDRTTGEWVWADFIHQTARPVDGALPDPHLHAHCFVFNATWDAHEQQVKAGQFRDIKRDMPYYQARFHKTLSDKLTDLGYRVRRTDKSFEVEGVPQGVIDLFSKRTDEIGRVAKEKGITDAKTLDALGARTRAKKQQGVSMEELKTEWKRQIRELASQQQGEGSRTVRFAPADADRPKELLTPELCVDQALRHGFERASVLQDRRLLAEAYRHAVGNPSVTLEAVTKRFEADERILHVKDKNKTLCTTKEVLSEEQRMVRLARQGQGALKPLYARAPALKLDGQQAEAVRHVLTTPHRVSIIRGAAGTGKTTLMQEAVKHIERTGKKVMVVAPTAQASRGVLKEEGFERAETVARLLADKKMQQELSGQVLWVDEAGLLGTHDMTSLLKLATDRNARLILGGDTRQHSSVVRGDALRILNTVGGIKSAEVSKIYRQKNEDYRRAVEDLSQGKVREAFDKLDAIGFLHSVDPLHPHESLVNEYVDTLRSGKSALVVSPTHQQGDEVTEAIRTKMRAVGLLGKKEIRSVKYTNLNLTEAEKSDWRNLVKGQVIQFNQNGPGFQRGSLWTVAESSKKGVTLQDESGSTLPLPQGQNRHFDVLSKSEISLSKGDKVRITRNGFDREKHRLNNGQLLEVVSVRKKGDVVLRNEQSRNTYKLDKHFGHLAHAHCITSHASQGKTVDEVFISQPAATFPATDAKQFYVSVSRARERARIYTDDREQLLEHASELGERQSAIELINRKNRSQEMVHQHIRTELNRPAPEKTKTKVKTHEKSSPVKSRDHEPGI